MPVKRHGTRSIVCLYAASALALSVALTEAGAADQKKYAYDIPAQPLSAALLSYSAQSNVTIIASPDLVRGLNAPAVRGEMTPQEALLKLLGDTGLKPQINDGGGVTIIEAALIEKARGARPFRVAQLDQTAVGRGAAITTDELADEDGAADVIIVTGTNIRGIAAESSPVRTFTREDIQLTGAATAQDFIQTLPQNFGGGSNENISGLPNNGDAAFNFGRGSSVNLRGLGSGSTLVLLNGRRMAPSSGLGDFVDISVIPATAIERVEVLTDGASSIYGADAVAGVVNFVLRDDYDGVEASARYGSVTEGNLDEFRTGATGGKSWEGGNAILAYEFFSRTNLSAADRVFSQGAILPNDLSPSQRRHSVLASASHDLTRNLEIAGDLAFSSRETEQSGTISGGGLSFLTEAKTDTLNASAALSWRVADFWYVDASGSYSRVDLARSIDGAEADTIDSEIYTVDLRASGDLFSLPGGTVKLALGGHVRREDFLNVNEAIDRVANDADRDVYVLYGEAFIPIIGPDNAFPGMRRFEINVSGRYSDFSDFGDTANPKVGVLWAPMEDLRVRGSYSTSFNPPPLGRSGAADRGASIYPTALFNALFGLTPGDPSIADVTGLLVSGTADDLQAERSRTFTGGVEYDKEWGAHRISFKTTYFDIRFEDRISITPIPGNRLAFDAPNIAFNDPQAFPAGTVVFDPTADQIQNVLDSLDFPLSPAFPGTELNPFDAAFVNFALVRRNLSLSVVRGLDFEMNYALASDNGVYSAGVDGTYLNDFQQQAAPVTPIVEQVNTQFNPVDLKLRGRVGYANDGFSANVFVNYTNSYRVDNLPGAADIDSWTTVDINLAYDTGERFASGAIKNTQVRLSVLNLFNENPPSTPSVPSLSIFGFDVANASPLNRFVSFEVTKRF